MKKLFLVLVLGMSSLFASSGVEVYKAKCQMCHAEQGMMRAPAMPMVSARLKSQIKSRKEFIAFVKDYIQNPSKDKGLCMPMAYKKFGVMPPVGKGMSAEDRESISAWLYDNYKDSSMCKMQDKEKKMKCGAGKCGAKTDTKASKCGSVKIATH
ncbi:cytochrome c [Sulfurimonas sp. SAG-AH-194-C21]|nr:cytochrome c [Sulfurimonas sp. SAG-AH-194-C21]MDF1883185.1 cytochrome c [Sulfurimonas sp. SAG-AH-194-C21]